MSEPPSDKRNAILIAIAAHIAKDLGTELTEQDVLRDLKWHARFLPEDSRADYGTLIVLEVNEAQRNGKTIDAISFRHVCDRIAKRLAYHLRQHNREPLKDATPAASGERFLDRIAVKEVLLAMPAEEQLILLMFIEGYSLRTIGKQLNITASTLRRRFEKAVQQAKILLDLQRTGKV